MMKFFKNFNEEKFIIFVIVIIFSYMIYNVIINSKEHYCGCGSYKKEGFCGNLFSENCKQNCPQHITNYATPGVATKNKQYIMKTILKPSSPPYIKSSKPKKHVRFVDTPYYSVYTADNYNNPC